MIWMKILEIYSDVLSNISWSVEIAISTLCEKFEVKSEHVHE